MIIPDPDFRLNPNRAIYVQGLIDQQLVNRLTPEIISLQSQSRDPITIYIDSPGGLVTHMQALLNLLTASNQDFADPCHLITVVTTQAASAAADLLSSGDYALAFPESTILYHGLRWHGDMQLTAESTSLLAQHLRANNDSFAMELARKTEFRFMFRFIYCRNQFNEVRLKYQEKKMTDLDCFLSLISEQLSESANELLQNARQRHGRYTSLLQSVLHVMKKSDEKSDNKTTPQVEAIQLKAIIDFEVKSNRKNKGWTFETEGIQQLTDDFFLLNEYLRTSRSRRFQNLCVRWSDFLLTDQEIEEIANLPEADRPKKMVEKARPVLRPVWSFFVAFCHALQEGENDLTARDAFWLGLIDEVIGEEGLPSYRMISEYKPDEQKQGIENKADAASAGA